MSGPIRLSSEGIIARDDGFYNDFGWFGITRKGNARWNVVNVTGRFTTARDATADGRPAWAES
jgi:hypothetical protein